MFKVSLPTKKQWIDVLTWFVVPFVGSAVAMWVKQPNPFSKAAAIVAITTGVGTVLAIVKGFTTTL
jgi:hypothetical protein